MTNRKGALDLYCSRGSDHRRIEVKGTTGDGSVVQLTHGEVAVSKRLFPKVDLVVVYGIRLHDEEALGGTCVRISPWLAEEKHLTPVSYRYEVPRPS